MKQLITVFILSFFISVTYAQETGQKSIDKQEKLDRKSQKMENANRSGNGKKSLRQMHKMEKKEAKLNKKEAKMK